MADILPLLNFQNHASEGRSLGIHEIPPDNKRRSPHEEDRHLNVGASDHLFCERNDHHQLDHRRRRAAHAARPRRRLTNQGRPTNTEAASGGQRYSASAFKGLPLHQGRSHG